MKEFRTAVVCITCILFFCYSGYAQKKEQKSELYSLTSRALQSHLSKPDSSIKLTQNALQIAIASGDQYFEAYAYYLLAKAYWVKGNYRLSAEYGFKAQKIFETSSCKKELVFNLAALGRTLTELGDYAKAGELIRKALALSFASADKEMLAEVYREYSYFLSETNQLDSALYYTDKGVSLYKASGDSLNVSILYTRKSKIYFTKKDFLAGRRYAFRAMLLDTLTGNHRALGISYYYAAQNEYALKNNANAERLLQHALRIHQAIGDFTWLVRSHELLATIYLDTQKPAFAATQLKLVSQYKDSLYAAAKSRQVQEMQLLYELEGKMNTIKLLEKENALQNQEVKNQKLFALFLLVGISLLLLVLFILNRSRKIQNKTNRDLAEKNTAIKKRKEEMRKQTEALHQLNQLQTKLFSVISHDLRNPINNLQLLLDLFTKKMLTAEEMAMISEKLKINLNITQRTLENLLNWALSQMGGIKTEKKKICVKSCVEDACRLLEEVANRKNISIQYEVKEPIMAWADPDQVQLVLRNLIHNGIKFSKAGDPLVILISKVNGYCQIQIRDRGIGMTQQEIEMVIGAKEHFTKAGTDQEKGTGLGLLLCKEFIERNGGTLGIRSKVKEGTEVSFTLLHAS